MAKKLTRLHAALPERLQLTNEERAELDARVAKMQLYEVQLQAMQRDTQRAMQDLGAEHQRWVHQVASRVNVSPPDLAHYAINTQSGVCALKDTAPSRSGSPSPAVTPEIVSAAHASGA